MHGPSEARPYCHVVRYLCIDLGDKRTGLAVGDSITRIASPLSVIETAITAGDGAVLLADVVKAVTEQIGSSPHAKGELVLGLPLNMDGSDGQRARLVRLWGEKIAKATGRIVHMQDERLTTADADWQMARSGLTHKQKKLRRDALAAAAVLSDFLNALPASPLNP